MWDALVASKDFLNPIPFNRQDALHKMKTVMDDYAATNNYSPSPNFNETSFVFKIDGFSLEMLEGKLFRTADVQKKIEVQVETVPAASAFENISFFYICPNCGKVYWDGGHMKRYIKEVGIVVDKQ